MSEYTKDALEPEVLAHIRKLPFVYDEAKESRSYSCACHDRLESEMIDLCWYHMGMERGIETARFS